MNEHVSAYVREGDRLAAALVEAMKAERVAARFTARLRRRLEGLREDGLSSNALAILDHCSAVDEAEAQEDERLAREDAHAVLAFRNGLADGLPVRLM